MFTTELLEGETGSCRNVQFVKVTRFNFQNALESTVCPGLQPEGVFCLTASTIVLQDTQLSVLVARDVTRAEDGS